ncbi:MAG TPA: bifunctional methylenetetrahydrofolate dehydrogenase/methenyltetrahydrofolate cyclohydrolase FolD [Caldithrix abyssi]|uniref:Bifunctional protein FolD n=1 Tax=Caldithrix abyssi TaxID=187145 RepID=A0A7V4U385_CALAY|nr:bifunctional methylenetetrahydrofolate dehydrogenase/methenyltetrahydrofolate cyclohydrolase FolD [Caldithrix abyssi]
MSSTELYSEKLLSGKKVAAHVNERVAGQVAKLKEQGVEPKLSVILVGDDPASQVYVRRKEKSCQKLGILSQTYRLSAETTEQDLLKLIEDLNNDPSNHGILVQLPLPGHISEDTILLSVHPRKDVDCFHPQNVGLLVSGKPFVLPCTPAGIVEILQYYKISTEGRHVVVLGRSNIVGKPMANLLMQKNSRANATVTVAHSRTKNIAQFTRQADIVIAAIGKARFLTADMVKPGAVVIDVGINRIEANNEKGYALVGDADFEGLVEKVSAITPVPGGVGPMTIAMLMQNTVTAAAAQTEAHI